MASAGMKMTLTAATAAILAAGWFAVYGQQEGFGVHIPGSGVPGQDDDIKVTLVVDDGGPGRLNADSVIKYFPGGPEHGVETHHLPWERDLHVTEGATVTVAASADHEGAIWCRILVEDEHGVTKPHSVSGFGGCAVSIVVTR